MKQDDYKRFLQNHLISDVDLYDSVCVRIFEHPVNLIFFCIDKSSKVFFSVYQYMDIYVVISDLSGDIYEDLKESDDEIFCEIIRYLFKNLKIYRSLTDITIGNTYLSEEFDWFVQNNITNYPTQINRR